MRAEGLARQLAGKLHVALNKLGALFTPVAADWMGYAGTEKDRGRVQRLFQEIKVRLDEAEDSWLLLVAEMVRQGK